MTVPGIDTLSGPPAASSRRVARRSAEPALQPHPELACTHDWPLRSYRELRALPVSVRSARLQARKVLGEWHLEAFADPVELLVSELTTNAVRASAVLAGPLGETGQARRAARMRLWLSSDRHSVLIQVWDGGHCQPVRQDAGLDAEAGRGLLLVESLSAQWGCYAPAGPAGLDGPAGLGGKIVWALCAR
jgi:anti-sigma regulatory factor (Ser/Thr protein kinase)